MATGWNVSPRTLLVLVFLLCLAALRFGMEVVTYTSPGYGEDLAKHWLAPRVLEAGEDPYDSGATREVAESLGVIEPGRSYFHYLERYHYPPLNLVLFRPLLLLDLRPATVLWIVLSAFLYMATIPLLLRVLGMEAGTAAGSVLIAAMLCFAPALGVLELGQMEIAVFFLLVLGLRLEQDMRHVPAGLLVALAIHVKVFPGVMVPYFLLTRRWRMAAWTTMWTAVLAVLCLPLVGAGPCATYLGQEGAYAAMQAGWEQYMPTNLSLPSFLIKGAAFLSGGHEWENTAVWAGRVLALVLLSAALAVVYPAGRRGRREALWALGALFATTSLASGMTFQHHLLWLAVPIGLALKESWEGESTPRMVLTFLVPYLVIGTLDPWNQPLRNLTAGMGKTWCDIIWSIVPAAMAASALLLAVHSARRALGHGAPPTGRERSPRENPHGEA